MKDNKSALVISKPGNILDIINQKNEARKCSFDDIYPKLTHKSFLQKILNIIKNIQIELLSQVSSREKNHQFSNKTIINLLKDLKIEEQKEKDEVNKILADLYDMKTLARYTTQDLDLCIKECQEAIEKNPSFQICNRLGTCFFKKGRHVKARDAYMKAKELFPNEKDDIAEKYLKMALEEIENY